jgi:hypothetical protein
MTAVAPWWLGGWAIFAADVIVMANLAQIAGSYMFLLFGRSCSGTRATTTTSPPTA